MQKVHAIPTGEMNVMHISDVGRATNSERCFRGHELWDPSSIKFPQFSGAKQNFTQQFQGSMERIVRKT